MKSMKNAKIHFMYLIEVSLMVTIITFLLSYTIAYIFGADGFDIMEVALMSITPAVFAFIVSIIAVAVMINKYRQSMFKIDVTPVKRIPSVLIVFVSSVVLLLVLDSAFFFLIDKSIPHGFADTMLDSLPDNANFRHNYLKIREMPFMVQNGVFIAGATLIGCLISALFLKKEYS